MEDVDVDVEVEVVLGVDVAVGDDFPRIGEVVIPDGAVGNDTKAVFPSARPETCTSPELGEVDAPTVPVSVAAAAVVDVAAVVPGTWTIACPPPPLAVA